jgi:hypothetical protein
VKRLFYRELSGQWSDRGMEFLEKAAFILCFSASSLAMMASKPSAFIARFRLYPMLISQSAGLMQAAF